MTRAERFLEREAERQKREWEQCPPPRPPVRRDLLNVSLRDAPLEFQKRLHEILRGGGSASSEEMKQSEIHPKFSPSDIIDSDVTDLNIKIPKAFTATIVGSSQQGKTSMLNSLLNMFGFDFSGQRIFPKKDLLPTHSKNRAGLPFPLRLEYGDRFEMFMERWTAEELEALMQTVAEKVLDKQPDFFEDLEFSIIEKGSFLEFVSENGQVDEEGTYSCKSCAAAVLQADGGTDFHTFDSEGAANPSFDVHQAVFSFLLAMVKGQWFRYRRVTLRCPSMLLKQIEVGSKHSGDPYIVDLPGVGIVHDNNSLVEELVLRDVAMADTIIVLTGQRSFTQDLLNILRNSVFERLLDPAVVPPPTVAITNSRSLLGMQEKEMEEWRNCTLHGDMGWNKELKAFACEGFSSKRRYRQLTEIEPSLFPNDLCGFLEGNPHAQDVGVAFLVGYFMRLPQETLVAYLTDMLERANAYVSMVNELWQAPMINHRSSAPRRLVKEAMENRKQELQMALTSRLTISLQKQMFKWEETKTLGQQLEEMDMVADKELEKLQLKVKSLKDDIALMQQEVPQLVKQVLLEVAADWDDKTGRVVFERFLKAGEELAVRIYTEWVPKLFNEGSRSSETDSKVKNAQEALLNTLKERVPKLISSPTIQYTFTDAFRQMVRNLDVKELFKSARRGRSMGVTKEKLWRDIEALVRKWVVVLQELVEKLVHRQHESHHIKELVSRLKGVITETFDSCIKNFGTVVSALENIAQGQKIRNQDPMVVLHQDLHAFTGQLNGYLQRYKKMRDKYGAEELRIIQEAQYGSKKVLDNNQEHLPKSEPKRVRRCVTS